MKKYLPYILIGAVVAVILGVGFFNTAHAATSEETCKNACTGSTMPYDECYSQCMAAQPSTVVTGETLKAQGMSWANCVPGPGITPSRDFDLSKCAAVASYYIIYTPTALILWVAGQILNGAVNYSLDGTIFKAGIISNGWAISRDFANMFFIFILLYIAIATILQLSGYGMKDLLVKIIIIALLVNFSLLICHVIIDASNILALEFYNKMTTKADVVATTLFGENARNISGVFMAGFNPEKLLSTDSFDKWKNNAGTFTLVVCVLLMFLLGSLMNIVGAFVLFAGAVLFVIRIAVLWLIMLLAPLAFLAMVLPATSQYAKQWWDKLFNQAFFAPAFLFLFYLVSKLIAGDKDKGIPGIIQTMFDTLSKKTAGLNGINAFFGSIVTIFIFFIIMTVLMIACLIVAQKMGAYGAGTMMKWGKDAKKWGQGYAGKISKRGAGYAAERVLDEKSRIGKTKIAGVLRGTPLVGRGLAKVSSWGQQEKVKKQKEYEKQYGSYSTAGLQAELKDPTVSDARKAAAKGALAKKQAGEREKQELERLERHLPTMETLAPGLKQKIKSIDSDIEDIMTDVTAAEYKLAEAVKSGNTMAINLAKSELNVAKKQKAQKVVEKQKAVESLNKIEKYRERKEKLEERKERKGETAGLQASISGIKTGGGGKTTP